MAGARRTRARRRVRPPLRSAERPAVAAPERARRARQRGRRRARAPPPPLRGGRRRDPARARGMGPCRGRAPVQLRDVNRWIATVRLLAVPFAAFQVAAADGYPDGYEAVAWAATFVFAGGAIAFWVLRRRAGRSLGLDLAALVFDVVFVSVFVLIFHFERGTPTRQLLFLPLVEGAARFALPGALLVAASAGPVVAWFELLRSRRFGEPYQWNFVTFQLGVAALIALLVGFLVRLLAAETTRAAARADEAEALRDELGRRADLLDAAGRCARALSSSLNLEQAFNAFIRELRGLVPFDRMAIVLADEGRARVIATAGASEPGILAPGDSYALEGNVLSEVLRRGQTIYRDDIADALYEEEHALTRVGINARVVAPLLVGATPIGLLSIGRKEARSFASPEIELVSLLGRLVATAVQNIRAFDAERRTVEELRRLSALRADFISLVSHELRSPMAAVIGSARTCSTRHASRRARSATRSATWTSAGSSRTPWRRRRSARTR